jgi:hypothetical protein
MALAKVAEINPCKEDASLILITGRQFSHIQNVCWQGKRKIAGKRRRERPSGESENR